MLMNILKSLFGEGNAFTAKSLKAQLDSGEQPFILDVREDEEYRAGHIVGAKHIPLHNLQQALKQLPQDTQIICVCFSGSRSGMAVTQLTRAGLNAINLQGGMMGWQRAGFPIQKGQ